VVVDAAIKTLGFGRIHRWLHGLRRGSTLAPPAPRVQTLSSSVDRAASLYFRRAWCLERSLVAMLLMRLRGWPAELVLGVRRMPFAAHAWVEVRGRVVNDDPRVQRQYSVLERCGD
jgi:transglutaminase-like putative cysteine protease